jgi:hypothetical protein
VRCIFHFKDEEFHGCYLFGYKGHKGFRRREKRVFRFLTYNLLELEGLNREKNFRLNICLRRFVGFFLVSLFFICLTLKILSDVGIKLEFIMKIFPGGMLVK